MEVQSSNAALVVGRLVGIAAGMVLLWSVVGPMLAGDAPNGLALIVAFFALAYGGLLLGQWVTLLLLRR